MAIICSWAANNHHKSLLQIIVDFIAPVFSVPRTIGKESYLRSRTAVAGAIINKETFLRQSLFLSHHVTEEILVRLHILHLIATIHGIEIITDWMTVAREILTICPSRYVWVGIAEQDHAITLLLEISDGHQLAGRHLLHIAQPAMLQP